MYADLIKEIAVKQGHPDANPRWIEGYMRLEYPSLNGVSRDSFEREVVIGIACIEEGGPEQAEECAKSFGL